MAMSRKREAPATSTAGSVLPTRARLRSGREVDSRARRRPSRRKALTSEARLRSVAAKELVDERLELVRVERFLEEAAGTSFERREMVAIGRESRDDDHRRLLQLG